MTQEFDTLFESADIFLACLQMLAHAACFRLHIGELSVLGGSLRGEDILSKKLVREAYIGAIRHGTGVGVIAKRIEQL